MSKAIEGHRTFIFVNDIFGPGDYKIIIEAKDFKEALNYALKHNWQSGKENEAAIKECLKELSEKKHEYVYFYVDRHDNMRKVSMRWTERTKGLVGRFGYGAKEGFI